MRQAHSIVAEDALLRACYANSGGSGPVDGETIAQVAFSFDTPSPLVLQSVSAGQVLNRAALLITTPFDGLLATVELGTSTTPGLVLAADNSTINNPDGQYSSDLLVRFAVSDILQLTINPAGSTVGAGVILYKLK